MTQHVSHESKVPVPRTNKREANRAEALRENLRKRKLQQQMRSTASDKPSEE